jgi:chromosome segregation ATPase
VERLENDVAEADHRLQDDLETKDARLEDLELRLSGQETDFRECKHELQDAKAYIVELETDTGVALDQIEACGENLKRSTTNLLGTTTPPPHSSTRLHAMPSS